MSYILEALKKADQERVVGKVPDIDSMHDPATPPPRRKFRWIWILGALLVVNGILVAALMLRNDAADGGPEQAAADRVPAVETSRPPADRVPAMETSREPADPVPAMETSRPPVATPAIPLSRVVPPRQPAARSPVRPYVPPVASRPAAPAKETTAAVSSPAPKVAGTVTRAEAPLEAEAPMPESPAPVPAPAARQSAPAVPAATPAPVESAAGLPYWDDLSLEFRSGFTAPRIDVHVYDTDPQRRFILVELKKYREGDRLASGALLEKITPEGVQLSVRGKQFIYRQ
jgi:general secretion pathway protein B